jgi:hypothetical protein
LEHSNNKDISVIQLISYNLVFFIPLIILYFISNYFSEIVGPMLDTSPKIAAQIMMFLLSLIIFFILVPFLRIRESVKAVRLSLLNFVVMGFVMTIPSLIQGNYEILLTALLYLANFIFAVFINSPDVIGISGDPEDWFKHKVQIMIFLIYVTIVLLYVCGFGWMYYQMAIDTGHPNSFRYVTAESPKYFTFVYFSIISMATAGYGDITPLSIASRLVMCIQVIMGMIINVVFIAILFMHISFFGGIVERQIEKRLEKEARLIEKEEEKLVIEEQKIRNFQENIENDQISRLGTGDYGEYKKR